MQRRILIASILALLTGPALAQQPQRAPNFERSTLLIDSATGKQHRFTVELADSDERRAHGLMHRDAMPPDHGMIFDFKADQPVAMWMRNTRPEGLRPADRLRQSVARAANPGRSP